MQLSTDAVVIREKKLAEHDRLLTLLTRDKGVLTAYARGAGRLRGSLLASTEFLCYSHFQLFQNRDRTSVDRAESEMVFFRVRQDLGKLSLATYFCQLCCELVPELDCDEGYLRLLLNSLFQLERDKMPPQLLKPLFELRCLSPLFRHIAMDALRPTAMLALLGQVDEELRLPPAVMEDPRVRQAIRTAVLAFNARLRDPQTLARAIGHTEEADDKADDDGKEEKS